MPKVKKVTTDEKPKKKYNGISPLDFIKFLTSNKTKWEDLPDDVKKQYPIYIINLWLSMNYDLVPLINLVQGYNLTPSMHYKVLLDLLPNQLPFSSFIKSKLTDVEKKMSNEVIEFISMQEKWSNKETIDNLNLILLFNPDIINEYLLRYGLTEKNLKKIV